MVIELGLSSGYLMAGFLFPAKFIAERIFGCLVSPMNGRKGNENFSKC